jgi:plastocyanin
MQLGRLLRISGLFILTASPALAETHVVTQNGIEFTPSELVITVGDTVEWVWTAGSHTVTNGVDTSDPDVGTLFDTPLNSSNPSVSFTFDVAGEVPYFCRPHLTLGMTGTITIIPAVPVEDTHWGEIKDRFRQPE